MMSENRIKQQVLEQYHEIKMCRNCAGIIANAECSDCVAHSDRDLNGEPCPEAAAIAARYPLSVWCVVPLEDDGETEQDCDCCGVRKYTQWMTGEAFQH